MPALQPARGTQDLLPEAARRHRRVSETARERAALYGFAEIATPIFEFTEVFARPIGEHTDIVAKEMYTLHRPRRRRGDAAAGEHRRGRARGAVERADAIDAAQILLQRPDVPLRAAAEGPLPPVPPDRRRAARRGAAAGRYRGHRARRSASCNALGIGDRVVLELNTLGDPESRAAYREALVALFLGAARRAVGGQPAAARRQPAAHPRFERPGRHPDQRRGAAASTTISMTTSHEFFAAVRDGLDRLGIAYRLNPRLVRGLDYYTHTVFEFVTTDLGAQGTVMARRALRRAGRADGRAGDGRGRLGRRDRAAGAADRRAAGAGAAGRAGADRRGGRGA